MNYRDLQDDIKWVASVKRQWAGFLRLVTFLITSIADNLMEISSKAIFLIVPAPNALNVYHISYELFGFGQVSSIAFALTAELALFASIEKALRHFEGWNKNHKKYRWTFTLIITSTVLVSLVISVLVYTIEVQANGNRTMALLPFLSLLLFLIIGLDRWHERQPEGGAQRVVVDRKPQNLPQKPLENEDRKPQNLPQNTPALLPVGGGETANPILQFLFANPNSKAIGVAKELGISKPTAVTRLRSLVDEGKVVEELDGQSYRYRLADDYNVEEG